MLATLRRKRRAEGGPWALSQDWEDVLFAHWPVEAPALSRLIPPPLMLELQGGSAWLTIATLKVSMRFSSFAELNVRTYVRHRGKSGVYFFTLDAGSPLALLARPVYGLPYRWTNARIARRDGTVWFENRHDTGDWRWQLSSAYKGTGPERRAAPGSLEEWLLERRRLFTASAGDAFSVEVSHEPWPLQDGEARFLSNTLLRAAAIRPVGEPLLHYSRKVTALIGPPRRES